jgi:hypothetical protein
VTEISEEVKHLEQLAAELTKRRLTAQVVTGRRPYLKVASVESPQLNERVFCEQGGDETWRYSWPWRQAIGPVDDLNAVILKITAVLRPIEGSS